MEKKILPILVVYNCQIVDSVAYESLIKRNSIKELVVYDNSPECNRLNEDMRPQGVHYFHDVTNGGLSKAYNFGSKIADKLGYTHLLLLDQDTYFPENAWECYTRALVQECMLVPNVVLEDEKPFSPAVSRWNGMRPVTLPEGFYSLYQYNVINSGCCVPLVHFLAAGGYKENVMLDFSDYQFQLRLRKVCDEFYVLPFKAKQDFSNNETDEFKLMNRFLLYLRGALNFECEGLSDRLIFNLQVLKHSFALTLRTRNMNFMVCYLKKYLLHR